MSSTAMKLRATSYWPKRPNPPWSLLIGCATLLALLVTGTLGAIPAALIPIGLVVAGAGCLLALLTGARHEAASAQPVLYRLYRDHLAAHQVIYRNLDTLYRRGYRADEVAGIVAHRAPEAAQRVTAAPAVLSTYPELACGAATQTCLLLGVLTRAQYTRLLDTAQDRAIRAGTIPGDAATYDDRCQDLAQQFTRLGDHAAAVRSARAATN